MNNKQSAGLKAALANSNPTFWPAIRQALGRCIIGSALALAALPSAFAQQAAGDAKAGAEKRSQCIGCHGIPGYKASFPRVYNVPMISGQNAKYIEAALTAYRKGDRPHPTMRGIAWSLTDADIADLAAYYAGN